MNINKMIHVGTKFLVDRSPQILTGLSVAGVVSTAVLAVKATPEALYLIDKAQSDEQERELTPVEKVKAAWVCYIPAFAVGTLTITSIVLNRRISDRRQAALVGLYALTEANFREYRDKVVETIGKNKEQSIQTAVVQDKVNTNPVSSSEVLLIGAGNQLCYDQLTGRYFMSDMQTLQKAEIAVNQKIINESYASQNDFYRMIDLPTLDNGENVGWNTDQMLHLDFTPVMSDDDRPCIAVKYRYEPLHGYYHTF